ncbi:hypothetical protein [Pseudomonas fontis]|nr:hypothetical protein [Pseudomonas fontis]
MSVLAGQVEIRSLRAATFSATAGERLLLSVDAAPADCGVI